jgi:hypothetical protein
MWMKTGPIGYRDCGNGSSVFMKTNQFPEHLQLSISASYLLYGGFKVRQ